MIKKGKPKGFTLIEVLVSFTLLGVTLATVTQIFLSQAQSYKGQAAATHRHQGVRASLELIARDLRSAGYPVLDQTFLNNPVAWIPSSFIPKIPRIVNPKGIMTVTEGGSGSDILSFFTVLSGETNPTVLSQASSIGNTSIRLALTGSETNDQFNLYDLIYIGKIPELAQVKGIYGNILEIDTDPFTPGNQGLKKAYPAGTEIGEISLVSYAVFNDQNDSSGNYHDVGSPVLKRKTNAGGFEPLAEGIVDLKISQKKEGLVHLQLSALTCPANGGPQTGQEKWLTLRSQVFIRN
jgi:prepilin-type N-terminal cleavage/methylation domain-containing protein